MRLARRFLADRRRLVTSAALLAVALVGTTYGAAGTSEEQPEPIKNTAEAGTEFDPTDWLQRVRQRADALADQADAAANPADGVKLWQAAANVALARELVPVCAQWLLGPSAGIRSDQTSSARDSLQRADEWLNKARGTLDNLSKESGSNDSHEPTPEQVQMLAQSRQVQRALEAFSSGLRAMWLTKDESNEHDERKAASELTILLESDDPRVVTAASVWYAALRSREPELSPSLSVLGFALTRPPVAAERIGLMGKLLHCRLIARQDGFAAALTLLSQLEELSRDWFADSDARQAALAAITAVEIEVLHDWEQSLSGDATADEREWCQKRRAHLAAERPIDPAGLLEFLDVIPLLRDEARRP